MLAPENDKTFNPDVRWVLPIYAAFIPVDPSEPSVPRTRDEIIDGAYDFMPAYTKKCGLLQPEEPVSFQILRLIKEGYIVRDDETGMHNVAEQGKQGYAAAVLQRKLIRAQSSTDLIFRAAPIALPAGPLGEEYIN